jgi:hypothetical protein
MDIHPVLYQNNQHLINYRDTTSKMPVNFTKIHLKYLKTTTFV